MRSQFEKEFDRLGICGKEILPGEIWTVKDEIIIIPETRLPGFKGTEHEYRPIVILSCQEDCKDPQTITVVICPLTTRTDIVHQTDCFLSVMEGSVKEESLAHLGLIQPILNVNSNIKVDHFEVK